MRKDISNFTVTDQGSIRDAVEAIDRGVLQIVLVLDSNGVLKGTITDGDVRRGLLRGMSLDGPLVFLAHAVGLQNVDLRALLYTFLAVQVEVAGVEMLFEGEWEGVLD